MNREPDAYSTLGVDPSAPAASISAAYRALARLYHPDGNTPDAAQMTRINLAYDLIKTPELRRRYDTGCRLVAMGPGHPERQATAGPIAERLANARAPQVSADLKLDFGQYAGWRVVDVAYHDPEYLRWLSRLPAGRSYAQAIALCLSSSPRQRRSSTAG